MAVKDNYGDDAIEVKEGTMAVRHRPGMYIGDIDSNEGLVQISKEVTDNVFDEVEVTPDKQHLVDITLAYKGKNFQMIVTDTGRGIPLDGLETVFTKLHSSGKWGDNYSASIGSNGVGLTATGALSTTLCAISRRATGTKMVVLAKGNVIKNQLVASMDDPTAYGTTIMFQPDDTIFPTTKEFKTDGGVTKLIELLEILSAFIPNVKVRVSQIKDWVTQSFLTTSDPIAIYQTFADYKRKVIFESDDLMTPMVYMKNLFNIVDTTDWSLSLNKPLDVENSADLVGYNINMFLPRNPTTPKLITTINSIVINDFKSHHVTGVIEALKHHMASHIEHEGTKKFFISNYRIPLCYGILAKCKGASFINQTKDAFRNIEFLKSYTEHIISNMADMSLTAIKELYLLLEEDILEKYQIHMNKNLVSNKGFKNINLTLNNPKSYLACVSENANIRELFIVEGMSAGGIVGTVRDNEHQAVFKLRGKPLNPYKTTEDTMYNNLIYQDLSKVLGVTPNDKNLDNLKFKGGIFVLADADIDGCHIIALVQGILNKINPLLLSEGHVHVSNPPLYALTTKNNKLFLKDHQALMDTKIDKVYRNAINIEVKNLSTGVVHLLTGDAFRDFCYLTNRVGELIGQVSKNLAIQPIIIEQLIHCVDYLGNNPNTKKIRELLQADMVEYDRASNSLILGVKDIDIAISLTNLESEIRSYLLPTLQKAQWDKFEVYIVTADNVRKPQTFMQLFQLFGLLDNMFKVSRFKGLGEMEAKDLSATCLQPATRAFVSITKVGDIDVLKSMLGVDPTARKILVAA